MKCFINGKRTEIVYTAVNMPPYNGLSEVGCCIFSADGETEICIEFDEKVVCAAVRPLALNTEFYTYGNSAS